MGCDRTKTPARMPEAGDLHAACFVVHSLDFLWRDLDAVVVASRGIVVSASFFLLGVPRREVLDGCNFSFR